MKKTVLFFTAAVFGFSWNYAYNCWISKKNSDNFIEMINVTAANDKEALTLSEKEAKLRGYDLKMYKISCFRMRK